MTWRAWTLFTALLMCSFCACPNPRQTFTIQIINGTTAISLLSLTIGTIGPGGEATTDELLSAAVGPGETESLTVNVADVGVGNSLRGDYTGGAGFGIQLEQPFEAGTTIYMTMSNGEIINNFQFADVNIVVD